MKVTFDWSFYDFGLWYINILLLFWRKYLPTGISRLCDLWTSDSMRNSKRHVLTCETGILLGKHQSENLLHKKRMLELGNSAWMNKLINKIYKMFKGSVQPRNKAHARSATTSYFAVRTRKPLQEVKMSCFCSLPTIWTFETEEVESLTAKTRNKLKI